MRTISLNLILLASAAISSCLGANIVANPSFQSGNLNPWVSNTQIPNPWEPVAGGVSTGCAGDYCVGQFILPSANYLYQDLATTAGATYNLSFDYSAHDGVPSDLKVLWDGSVVLDLVDSSPALTRYTVSDLAATSGSTRLLFLGRQDPGFNLLTNVNVEQASAAAPEPAATALVLGGIGLLGGLRLRRKQQA